MQVKKFEARTMKEALEMVKTQLGPDAIILSARDNKKFGLVGEGSVEITAAVSENTLQKKRFVESRFKEDDREKFSRSPAKVQKDIIEKMVNKHLDRHQQKTQTKELFKRAASSTRYADIEDDSMGGDEKASQDEAHLNPTNSKTKKVAQEYWMKMQSQVESQLREEPKSQRAAPANTQESYNERVAQDLPSSVDRPSNSTNQVKLLQAELDSLRKVISDFQKIPQSTGSSYPGFEYGLSYEGSWLFEKLCTEGVNAGTVAELLLESQKELTPMRMKNRSVLEGLVAKKMLDRIRVSARAHAEKFHLFTGPAGCGKTSTIIKLASHLILKEKKRVALISTDTFKVGSAEQMKIFAQILNVPFVVVRDTGEWSQIFKHTDQIDHVLVDFPGLSLKSKEEVDLMRRILPPVSDEVRTHLVVSSKARDRDLLESAKRYGQIHFDDLIFTGLDESVTYGNIYNLMDHLQVPLYAFGIGSRVPEDIEFATRERLLDLVFKITQQRALERAPHGE